MPGERGQVVLDRIRKAREEGITELALLLDPEKVPAERIKSFLTKVPAGGADYIFVGGSFLVDTHLDVYIRTLKRWTDLPVILFPGHAWHVSTEADALLFLSLISGRNPDLLIGQQVHAASRVAASGLETIPTGYLLVDGGKLTSVLYMSQTLPIPSGKTDIALSTALAGQLLGMQLIYLEAGSGAVKPVPEEMVKSLSENLSVPLIAGGGIRSPEQAAALAGAGASLLVVGTAAEQEPLILEAISEAIDASNSRNNRHRHSHAIR